MSDQKEILSAQVILNSASGLSPTGSRITSENINKFLPLEKNITLVKKTFSELGFEVGDFTGISFSITAPADTFIKKFGIKIPGKVKSKAASKTKIVKEHLPVNNLPSHIINLVHDIVFPDPPDFGPGNF